MNPSNLLTFLSTKNIQCTLLYYYIYMWFGMLVAAPGPCLLSLSRQINEPIESVTLALTTRSCSYLFGAVCIFFVGDKIDQHKLLQGLLLVSAAGNFGIPTCTSLVELCLCMIPTGLMMGVCGVFLNSLIFKLHKPEAVNPFMHFNFGLGTVIFPFVVGAILGSFNGSCGPAFYILGAFPIPAVIVMFFYPTPNDENKSFYEVDINDGGLEKVSNKVTKEVIEIPLFSRPNSELIAIFGGMSFLLFQLFCEIACGTFLSPYSVRTPSIGYTEVEASNFVGGFYVTYAASRVLATIVSTQYTTYEILRFNSSLGMVFLVLGSIVGAKSPIALWILTLGYGLCSGPFFATIFTFTKDYVDITYTVSTIIICGASIGEIIGGIGTVSALEKNTEFLWYLLIIALAGIIVSFNITRLFSTYKSFIPKVVVCDTNASSSVSLELVEITPRTDV